MNIPDVRMVSFDEMMELAGGAENIAVSVFLRVEGEAPGSMFFVLPLEEASRFIQILTNDETFEFSNPPYSEIGLSAMHELGNILSGSYLSALSDFTKLHIYPSVPSLSIDMIGALLSYGLIEISTYSDRVIVIDTALEEVDGETNTRIQGHFFLLPDPNSFETIFSSLGVSS